MQLTPGNERTCLNFIVKLMDRNRKCKRKSLTKQTELRGAESSRSWYSQHLADHVELTRQTAKNILEQLTRPTDKFQCNLHWHTLTSSRGTALAKKNWLQEFYAFFLLRSVNGYRGRPSACYKSKTILAAGFYFDLILEI